jgi:hypothetical protein
MHLDLRGPENSERPGGSTPGTDHSQPVSSQLRKDNPCLNVCSALEYFGFCSGCPDDGGTTNDVTFNVRQENGFALIVERFHMIAPTSASTARWKHISTRVGGCRTSNWWNDRAVHDVAGRTKSLSVGTTIMARRVCSRSESNSFSGVKE